MSAKGPHFFWKSNFLAIGIDGRSCPVLELHRLLRGAVVTTPVTSPRFDDGIDVVMRLHDTSRTDEMERAALSVIGQDFRPIRIIVVLQRFPVGDAGRVHKILTELTSWAECVDFEVLNFTATSPLDARAELLNLGLATASRRYFAILDFDDVIFPHAYRVMTDRLANCGAAIAFARTPVANAQVTPGFVLTSSRSNPFSGETLSDLFTQNFCPIHSYVLDRSRIPSHLLRFEQALTIEEDYEFLIRVCAAVPSDFARLDTDIGLYTFKEYESSTFSEASVAVPGTKKRMAEARAFVAARRKLTIIEPDVQRILNISEFVPNLTIQDWLDESHSVPKD